MRLGVWVGCFTAHALSAVLVAVGVVLRLLLARFLHKNAVATHVDAMNLAGVGFSLGSAPGLPFFVKLLYRVGL